MVENEVKGVSTEVNGEGSSVAPPRPVSNEDPLRAGTSVVSKEDVAPEKRKPPIPIQEKSPPKEEKQAGKGGLMSVMGSIKKDGGQYMETGTKLLAAAAIVCAAAAVAIAAAPAVPFLVAGAGTVAATVATFTTASAAWGTVAGVAASGAVIGAGATGAVYGTQKIGEKLGIIDKGTASGDVTPSTGGATMSKDGPAKTK